jgi:hypothetical protein
LYSNLEQELHTKQVTVITGMRQVGKTTALGHLFAMVPSENKILLDLENPLYRKLFEEEHFDNVWNNLRQFNIKNTEKAYIFLDEVQNLPNITRVIKYLYDHWDVKFVLTGSSSYYLRNLFPESLAGRKIVFEMFPLTFSEFLVFKQVQRQVGDSLEDRAAQKNRIAHERLRPYYMEYLQFGGFPAVVLEQNLKRKSALLTEIFTSYFEKDAKNLADFRDMAKLRDLILLLVPRVGSQVEILKLANALGVARETIYNYLSFLEQTYVVSLLPKHSSSIDRRAAGSKKLYFCDTGLARALGDMSQGQSVEQSVFQCLRGNHALSFYHKNQTNEIDFILDDKIALEVKMSMSQRDMANLIIRSKTLLLQELYIASLEYTDHPNAILLTDL